MTVVVDRPGGGVAVLRLHRPDRLNAFTPAMLEEIRAACAELQADDSVGAVVLTGSGRGFCAGYDLDEAAELPGLDPAAMLARQDVATAAVLAIRGLRQPVVAAVHGPAAGGGLALALAADLRLVGPAATFSAAFIRLGLSAGDMGCSWHLPRLVGPGLAAELMFTGRRVDAAEAVRIGLANRVCDDVLADALALATEIAGRSPLATALSKRSLWANLDVPSLATAMELEGRGQAFVTRDPVFATALAALREQVRGG
jgi:enoyl-CoA hydratase/carnithine racemase